MDGLVAILKELSNQTQQLVKKLVAYERLLNEPVPNAYERERLLNEVERIGAGFAGNELRQQLLDWVQAERSRVEEAKAEFRFEFGKKLLLGLEGSGLEVGGQLPLVRAGFFFIRADFVSGRATVYWGPEIEQLKTGVKLEPLALAKLVRAYYESLIRDGIKEPQEFLSRLFEGYRRVCHARDLTAGERILLIDLLAELVLMMQPERFRVNPVKENFVDYPRVRFSYDLYLLRRSGVRVVGGQELRLTVANFDATTRKTKALWVPDNEAGEGTYYSYISFVPVREV
ncbi:MAG: hypothetical protein ACP5JB_06220 [candidate division WOR-3 bacterium]|jgi:hypothetical protein